jgi:glucose/arabinose dehydrogenase
MIALRQEEGQVVVDGVKGYKAWFLLLLSSIVAIEPLETAEARVRARKIVRCLQPTACWITAFAFTPNSDQIFYVERFTGQIRRFDLGSGRDRRWARIPDIARGGEQGALGLALDPGWSTGRRQRRVFVFYTEANPRRNRIVRLWKSGKGLRRTRLLSPPGAVMHNGGVLHFGPDERLYAVTGDAAVPRRAQRVRGLAGKVLRMNENGGRARGNPFPTRAYSIGHRNSFGFAWDPRTERLWQTENGPECDDEVNLVRPGRNYGWGPSSRCPRTSESGSNPVQPVVRINPRIAPTGVAFCDRCGLAARRNGDLFVGSFNHEMIYSFELGAARRRLTSRSILIRRRDAVLAIEAAPNGQVFFSDVRGIYRLFLKASTSPLQQVPRYVIRRDMHTMPRS